MRYRQAPFQPDLELIAMLDALRQRIAGDELTLVLNGDIFDFDAPYLDNGVLCHPDVERTPTVSARIIAAILSDHQAFLRALGRLLAAGHRIVFVSGNHDAEMTIPAVRTIVRDHLTAAAVAEGASLYDPTLSERLMFRSWFYLDRDRLLFEHGHQYDELNCYRTIMHPYERDTDNIAPTFGSLVSRFFATRMGYFNPNVDASYLQSAVGYTQHWFRYYLFSTRSFIFASVRGFTNTIKELIAHRSPETFAQRLHNQLLAVAESGATKKQIQRHLAAGIGPIDDDFRRVFRRLSIDHITFSITALVAALVWLHYTSGKLMLGAAIPPSLYLGYIFALPPMLEIDSTWHIVQRKTRVLAPIYHANAVVFGHTHRPEGEWVDGVFFGNTGSWSAAFADVECTKPLNADHPLIWLSRANDVAPITGGLFHWKNGDFQPFVIRPAA